jgi:regulator of cell morphogenesis and NO signaling
MTINVKNTVRELALTVPGATRIFEQFGIDYCCGGYRSLSDACRTHSVEVEEVIHSLEALRQTPEDSRDWRDESLASLAEYIIDIHHLFTKHELDRLQKLFDKVCSRHGVKHPELFEAQRIFAHLREELIPHMRKEEQVLFPYISWMEKAAGEQQKVSPPFFGTVRNPVRVMIMEHDAAGDLLIQLRSVTNGYTAPPDGCVSFQSLYQELSVLEADLHQHIHLENNILFPRAVEMEEATAQELYKSATVFKEHRCFGQ